MGKAGTATARAIKAWKKHALASLIGRGARFFLVAGLMAWGGEKMEAGLRRHVDRLGWLTVAVVVAALLISRI